MLLSAAKNSTASRNNKSNVLSDMLSDSKKYKDLRSETHTYLIKKIGSKRIEKSLYLIPADYKSAGTLALLLHIRRHNKYKNCREATRLMFWRTSYPTAKNIRICDPRRGHGMYRRPIPFLPPRSVLNYLIFSSFIHRFTFYAVECVFLRSANIIKLPNNINLLKDL